MPVDFPSPPADLSKFPTRQLRSGTQLYRLHHANLGPFWFGSFPSEHVGAGRFDLEPPQGTSYWALQGEAAFLETIARRPVSLLPLELLDRFALSIARCPQELVAANSPVKRSRSFGLTAEFHTTADYGSTRAWALALHEAGRRALIAIPRHDVTARLRSVCLFDTAGEHDPFGWAWSAITGPIPSSLIDAMADWGIRCLPIPFDVDVIDSPGTRSKSK